MPTLRRRPYKKQGLTTPQKLIAACVFLAFVAFAIGGEDRPGIVTMAQKTVETDSSDSNAVVLRGNSGTPVAQPQENAQDDAALSDWYASAAPEANPLIGSDNSQQDDKDYEEPDISSEELVMLEGQIGPRN